MRPARILVLRGGALGDFIVTLPALAALRERWPDSHIEVIGYPHTAQLAVACRLINHVRSIHDGALARYFAPDAPIRDEDQSYFASFDFIVNYLHDPDGHLADNLKRCGVAVLVSGSPLVADGHAVDHFLRPLAALAMYETGTMPRLDIDIPDMTWPARPWVAIHPGSGSRDKNWPVERFIEIAGRLRGETSCRPVFFTGDAERAYIPGLDQALQGLERHHNLPLPQLAAMMARASAYLGNDSGISHLAAATGCPSLVLFGPSDPSTWSPRGRRVEIIASPGRSMSGIATDHVWASLRALLVPS